VRTGAAGRETRPAAWRATRGPAERDAEQEVASGGAGIGGGQNGAGEIDHRRHGGLGRPPETQRSRGASRAPVSAARPEGAAGAARDLGRPASAVCREGDIDSLCCTADGKNHSLTSPAVSL